MSSKKSIGEPTTERSSSQSKKKKVELDLPEILDDELRKEAEDECRTLEQHILYILKKRPIVLCGTRIVSANELVYRGDSRPDIFTGEINRNCGCSSTVAC